MKSIEGICEAVAAPKHVLTFPPWKRVNSTLRMRANFVNNGVVSSGVLLNALCIRDRPDEQVSISILAEIKGKSRCIARIDWRGKQHVNRSREAGAIRFNDAGRTHFHDPKLHQDFDFEYLFTSPNDLPLAMPIDPPPETFEELLARAADLLHIENLKDMPVPPWEPRSSLV